MESSRKHCFGWGPEFSQDLYVRSCGDFVLVPPDRERIKIGIDFAEIFWPISGECSFFYEGQNQILHPGQVFYYPPGACHDYKPLTPFHYCWMTIAGDEAAKFIDLLGIKPGINKAGNCPQELFAALGKDFVSHSLKHRIDALSIAFRILLQIAFEYSTEKNKSTSSMDFAKNLIDTNFDDPDLSVSSLSVVLHMHRASFSRAFRKAFSVTVTDYISYVRLQNAILKLEQTDLPVREIAESCGFSSANYFSKVFIAKIGTTPLKYRIQTRNIS